MNVNGIGAGYAAVGYETRKTERNIAGRGSCGEYYRSEGLRWQVRLIHCLD